MDENVHGAISDGLRARGVDLLTVQEDGAEGRDDAWVLDRATELGRLLFSQDDDLLREAAGRQRLGVPFVGVVFARQRHVPIGQSISGLELIAFTGRPEEFANQVRYPPCDDACHWFEIARNYAMFANEGGVYDELLAYIQAHRI